ncbi:MAG: hypothetical protein K1W18_05495 [Oscillospiraceae bacterium]
MAGSYDGSIRIDTSINAAPIDNGLAQIESKIKGLAATIGLAFGVKELIDFGKRSIDAASDLAEAQNVVDTAFDSMSWKMEQFAATALETYGISELTAKNMGSTYMAMAKGMGVATDAASDMAVTLTGRLSDIMSFYNKTQSEVDTIGRALITGETEPLKAIGVVMTQTNLSAYAMAQGFSKTYAEMSSNEQLLVRYKYFLEQTSLAQGDFAKTSEGWANQTRLLSERINEFMTNLGGVIMNVLTPALQFANEAVTFLNDLFFGGKTEEETTAAKNAEAVTDEITAVGTAADKSKKKLNNLLSGFDELHIISGAKSDDEESFDAGIDTSNLLGVNLDADTSTAKKAAQKYRDIINEIYLAFKRHPLTKAIEDIIKGIGKFFGFIKDSGDIDVGRIVDTFMDILGAILAYKAVSGAIKGINSVDKAFQELFKTSGKFGTGFSKLFGLISAHPYVAAVIGITALTIGIIALSEEMERQRIASHFGDISISLEEIGELVNPITENVDKVAGAFEDNKTKLTTAKENFSDIAKAVQETADSFKNNNIDQDVEGFAAQLDELINSALELNAATFDTSAIKSAFAADGTIDEEEQAILDQLADLGGGVAEKISDYGEEIHKITQKAIEENRELTEAEIANLESLYQKLADMTAQQENVKTSATWERLKNGAYNFDSYAELAEQIKEAQKQAEKSREAIEQSNYEAIMSMVAAGKESGKYSDEQLEKLKQDEIKNVTESMEAAKIEDKRYERDIILAWMQGAFKDMAESISPDPEQVKKMQDYFDLMVKTPESVDLNDLFSGLVLNDSDMKAFDGAYTALDKIKKQFGIDFAEEWTKLNEEIGDSAFSLEEFYDAAAKVVDNVTPLSVDDILPSIEQFKEQPKLWDEILGEWASVSSYSVSITGEIDTAAIDEHMSKYIAEKQSQFQLFSAPSNYVSPGTGALMGAQLGAEQYFNIQLNIDGVNLGKQTVKTNGSSTVSVDWHDPMKTNGG